MDQWRVPLHGLPGYSKMVRSTAMNTVLFERWLSVAYLFVCGSFCAAVHTHILVVLHYYDSTLYCSIALRDS